MGAYGFANVFAGRLSMAMLSGLELDPFAFSNAPREFLESYLRDGHYANDPVFAHARLAERPFRWRDAMEGITDEQRAVVDAFAQGGHRFGLCVPVERRNGLLGTVVLGRADDFALPPEAWIEIETLSRTLFAAVHAMRSTNTSAPIRLSQRQRDVLGLVAEGKTNWEAGQILGMSEYSVRDHLRKLAGALQTTNRTHTVVRAVQLGLIGV